MNNSALEIVRTLKNIQLMFSVSSENNQLPNIGNSNNLFII